MATNPESHIGTVGWGLLATGVVLWDILAPETLSSAADRALEHPVGKYLAIGATAIVGAHVLNVFEHFDIPDPIHELATFVTETMRERLGHGQLEKG